MSNAKMKIYARLMLIAVLVLVVQTTLIAKDIRFSGMLRSYAGGRISEGDIPLTEQTLDLELQGWGNSTRININPYAYIMGEGDIDWGVREAYIDILFRNFDFRIGKQAVVWGEAEGVFITDIVSPQDLRSFILADFREIRIGVPAIRANYYRGPLTYEVVWLPIFVPTSQPGPESIWYRESMASIADSELPEKKLSNSEVFGKIKYFSRTITAEIMAGYAWDDLPVLEGTVNSPDPFHERFTVVGGSFSTTLSSIILRSEQAVYLNRAFTTMPSPGMFGTSDHHQLHSLTGLDWSLLGIDMSAQYILQYINDYEDSLLTSEYEHTATFRLRDSYFADTLTLELFGYVGIDPADMLLRPSLTYSIEDGVEIKTGIELFFGDEERNFGRYDKNSLAYVSLRWYF